MAEVAASGITIGALAFGIAKSAVKLRSIWDQVQGAPEDILSLIEELEDLSWMLADSEEFQQRNPTSSLVLDSTPISRCLQRCKKEVDRLKELTDGLSNDLEHSSKWKKKRAAAKIVLKKEQIDRYKDRLDRTLRMLKTSHDNYMMVLLQLLPDIIVTKLSRSSRDKRSGTALCECSSLDRASTSCLQVTDLDEPASSEVATIKHDQTWSTSGLFGRLRYRKHDYAIYDRGATTDYSKKQEIEERIAEFWTPSWIAHRIWRLRAFKALSGWTLCFQTYNIIRRDSLAFVYTEENNLKGLQELFSRKLASPFDCDPSGMTLFLFATVRGSLDACHFLIEEGADLNYRFDPRVALEWFEWLGRDANDTSGLWRLLLAKTDREVDLGKFLGSSEGFSHWQRTVDPLYYQRPFEERFTVAFSIANCLNHPDLVRRALSLGSLPSLTYVEGGSLLIAVSKWLGSIAIWATSTRDTAWFSDKWRPFLIELIVNGAPLHYIDAYFYTPLLELLFSSIAHLRYVGDVGEAWISEAFHSSLSAWLESLQECGVNLEEYAEKEIGLHRQGLVSWSRYYPKWSSTVVLTDLTYGPLPSDWKVTWVVRDKETPYIPGGWIGDDGGDDEDGSVGDGDDDEDEDEDDDGSIGEVYEDCSVGDEQETSAPVTRTN